MLTKSDRGQEYTSNMFIKYVLLSYKFTESLIVRHIDIRSTCRSFQELFKL